MAETDAVTATAQETETTASESVETPAGAENTVATPQAEAAPGPIPYARFKEINEERKALKAQLEELQTKLAERATPVAPAEPATPEAPPEHLSAEAKLNWYIEKGARRLIESELGMPLKDAKTLLAVGRESAQDYAQRRWNDICRTNKVDPEDKEVMASVRDMVKKGYAPEDAIELSAARLGKGKFAPPSRAVATVESEGVTGVGSVERWIPRDKAEATAGAAKGKKAPHLTIEEIFEARKRKA